MWNMKNTPTLFANRASKILPGTGRWRGEAVTEGAHLSFGRGV